MSRFLLFLLLVACLAGQPRGTRRPTQTASTVPRVQQVDVAVSDSGGRPATNLTAADFDLTVGGKSLPVTSSSFVVPQPRRLVLVVDDAALSASAVDRVRASLTSLVDTQIAPGDEIAILRTRSGTGALEALTSDRKLLREAIQGIQFAPAGPASAKAREEFVLAGMAPVLRRALAGLGTITGRKAVVLITENLALARLHPELFKGFDASAANGSAVFYDLDLRDSPSAIDLDSLMLAGDTGGLNLGPDPAKGLERVLRDQQGYYLLSFAGEETGRTRVQLKNPSLHARFRSLPLGLGTPERDFRARAPSQDLAYALSSPFAGGAIRVVVNPIFVNSPTLGSSLTVQVWVDARGLSFTHQVNGVHRASAQVAVVAVSSTGTAADQTVYSVPFQLTDPEYRKVLQHGWAGHLEFTVRTPGAYQVIAAVRDETSSRMGTASRLVEVPDFAGGQLMLSSIAIYAKAATTLDASPVLRIFAPGTTLNFSYQILNPPSDHGKPAELGAMVRLFRGGAELYRGAQETLAAITLEDPKRRPVEGELKLGAAFPPGRYWLQVTVADKQSPQPRQAEQWVDFEVRP